MGATVTFTKRQSHIWPVGYMACSTRDQSDERVFNQVISHYNHNFRVVLSYTPHPGPAATPASMTPVIEASSQSSTLKNRTLRLFSTKLIWWHFYEKKFQNLGIHVRRGLKARGCSPRQTRTSATPPKSKYPSFRLFTRPSYLWDVTPVSVCRGLHLLALKPWPPRVKSNCQHSGSWLGHAT